MVLVKDYLIFYCYASKDKEVWNIKILQLETE